MSDAEAKRLAKFIKEVMVFIRFIHDESERILKKYEKST